MRSQYNRFLLHIAALLTTLVGIVNLISAVTPSLPNRVRWLAEYFPFLVRAGAPIFAAAIGFLLLVLAANLHGHSSLARFTLFDDKFYDFSASGKSVIAYVAKGQAAIALGDAIVGFQQLCTRNDWDAAFYQTLPYDLEFYQSLGLQALQIGEEAIVDLSTFTLDGKPGKNLRSSVHKVVNTGHQIEFYPPPIADNLLQELRPVSDEWLKMMQGSEKKFSPLGWFNDAYLRDCELAVV